MFIYVILSFSLPHGHYPQVYYVHFRPTSNHIKITVGFFNLHKGWLSLHMGHPLASRSEIDKPLVIYRFSGNIMKWRF